MGSTRRSVLTSSLAASALAWGGLSVPTNAAPGQFKLKFGSDSPEGSPVTFHMREVAKKVQEASAGSIEIGVFPNSQLGSSTDMLAQVRSGALDMYVISPGVLSTLAPIATISGVGYCWPSYDNIWPAMDGEVGDHVRRGIRDAGLEVFDRAWALGFRQVTSATRPITTPADFQGFKIRVLAGSLWTSLFTALGAGPTTINFAELYTSLQTKVVDGQENPTSVIKSAKFYEVQKYLSLTSHMWDMNWLIISQRLWRRYPADVTSLVSRIVNEQALIQREDVAAQNAKGIDDLRTLGLAVNTPDAAPFQEKLRASGFYKEWKEKFGAAAWAALEKYTGPIS